MYMWVFRCSWNLCFWRWVRAAHARLSLLLLKFIHIQLLHYFLKEASHPIAHTTAEHLATHITRPLNKIKSTVWDSTHHEHLFQKYVQEYSGCLMILVIWWLKQICMYIASIPNNKPSPKSPFLRVVFKHDVFFNIPSHGRFMAARVAWLNSYPIVRLVPIVRWLVVYLPLWKIWVRQLGLWKSQFFWKVIKFKFQSTNQIYIPHLWHLLIYSSNQFEFIEFHPKCPFKLIPWTPDWTPMNLVGWCVSLRMAYHNPI
jgi:hypothetical protein